MVDTPLWDTKPGAKELLGYHPKLAISAQTVAEAELELIESGKYTGGTVYEISPLGGRVVPPLAISTPAPDPKNPIQASMPKKENPGANADIWNVLAAERNSKL